MPLLVPHTEDLFTHTCTCIHTRTHTLWWVNQVQVDWETSYMFQTMFNENIVPVLPPPDSNHVLKFLINDTFAVCLISFCINLLIDIDLGLWYPKSLFCRDDSFFLFHFFNFRAVFQPGTALPVIMWHPTKSCPFLCGIYCYHLLELLLVLNIYSSSTFWECIKKNVTLIPPETVKVLFITWEAYISIDLGTSLTCKLQFVGSLIQFGTVARPFMWLVMCNYYC